MKKVLFALMVALATTFSFTSCNDDDEDFTLSDIANNTFAATESALETYNAAFPTNALKSFVIAFGATDFQCTIVPKTGSTQTFTGDFKVENNKIIAYNVSDSDFEGATLTIKSAKKIIVEAMGYLELKKQ